MPAKTLIGSDLHWGHTGILGYADRKFDNIDDHNEYLIDMWNGMVGRKDDVILLGDIFLSGRDFVDGVLKRLTKPRVVSVVPGNHDSNTTLRVMSEHGWRIEPLIYRRTIGAAGKCTMCHYPLQTWQGRHHLEPHLHGHCHSREPLFPGRGLPGVAPGIRVDVGVDAHCLRLWDSEELHAVIQSDMERVADALTKAEDGAETAIG